MLILHMEPEKLKFQMQSGSGRMGLGLPRALVHVWEGSRTGYVAVNWKQAFCGFSFGLDQTLAHILCSTSTHLQQEITPIFHLVKLFLC